MSDITPNKITQETTEETQSLIDKGLTFLLGKSKKTTIVGGIFAILLGVIVFPECLNWIFIPEDIQSYVLGYVKFLLFISGLFFARLARQENNQNNQQPKEK